MYTHIHMHLYTLEGSGPLHSGAVNLHDEFLNEGSPIASFLLLGFCFRAGPFFFVQFNKIIRQV